MKGQSLMILLAIYAMFMVSRIDAQRTSTVTRTTTTVTTVSVTISSKAYVHVGDSRSKLI